MPFVVFAHKITDLNLSGTPERSRVAPAVVPDGCFPQRKVDKGKTVKVFFTLVTTHQLEGSYCKKKTILFIY